MKMIDDMARPYLLRYVDARYERKELKVLVKQAFKERKYQPFMTKSEYNFEVEHREDQQIQYPRSV